MIGTLTHDPVEARPSTQLIYRRALRFERLALVALLGLTIVLADLDRWTTAGALAFVFALGVSIGFEPVAELVDSVRSGVVPVAVDLVATVAVLVLTEPESGQVAWLLLALPLIHAGVRRGVHGAVVAWLSVALAIGAWQAYHWDAIAFSLTEPAITMVVVLAAVLPVAHLADRMARRAGEYLRATDLANHRADILAEVFDATTDLSMSRRESIHVVLLDWAIRLTTGTARVGPAHDLIATPDLVAQAVELDGEAVVADLIDGGAEIAISLGSAPSPRPSASVLLVSCSVRPENLVVEALELLVIQARLALAAAADQHILTVDAEELVELLFARQGA